MTSLALLVAGPIALGQIQVEAARPRASYVEAALPTTATPYLSDRSVPAAVETVWRPICGGDNSQVTRADLQQLATLSRALAERAAGDGVVAAAGGPSPSGFDLILNQTTSFPPAAMTALADIEKYIESRFTDPVAVQVNIAFAPLGGAILGSTGVTYVQSTWATVQPALQADMDPSDSIQDYLPGGSTIPVRYDATTDVITNENLVYVPIAAYRAAIGNVAGVAAFITLNSSLGWDYTPPVIDSNRYSFRDVAIHEIAHALGFASGVDVRTFDIELLDVYRFQRSDGAGNYNPDTLEEFQVTPRTVDRDPPAPGDNDDVVSDLISAEYRMADGVPYQGSHFTSLTPGVYLMDPVFTVLETYHPDYLREGDLAMLDAIGWDYPPANTACEQASELSCGVRHLDNELAGGATDPPFSCGTGGAHDGSVWFSFTATSTFARLSTCSSSAQDSTIAVYEGVCGGLVEIACGEDGGCASAGLPAICLTDLVIGQTYYVQIAARTPADRGIYSLDLECSCAPACADTCCEPTDAADDDGEPLDNSRYIAFVSANPGRQTAVRVTFLSLYEPQPPNTPGPKPDFSAFNGQVRWVGPPQDFQESDAIPFTFRASTLQCEPYFQDWGAEELVYITGPEIVPSSVYQLQFVDEHCLAAQVGEDGFSTPLLVQTARWADAALPVQDPEAPSPNQPNILDVSALVDKLKGIVTAPPRVRAQLQPDAPEPASPMNILDVATGVDALKGFPYPFSGPSPCP